jgi:Cof subfamily protein (haloacid dehalogenase superfamily)
MSKLIAIDLDGTLFYPKKRIRLVSKQNISFLKWAKANGHEIVFVTSRNRQFVEKVLKEINLDIDFICRNGSVIVHQHQVILDEVMAKEDVQKVTQFVQSRHQKFMFSIDTKEASNLVFSSKYVWYQDFLYRFYYFLQGRYREDFDKNNARFEKEMQQSSTIQRLLVYFGIGKQAKKLAMEQTALLKNHFPHLEISWIQGLIEVASLGTNKGNSLKKLVDAKKWHQDDVIVIGDSGNDVAMFDLFPQSYCMDHAHPSIKKHARYVIKRVHHLKRVLLSRSVIDKA